MRVALSWRSKAQKRNEESIVKSSDQINFGELWSFSDVIPNPPVGPPGGRWIEDWNYGFKEQPTQITGTFLFIEE